MDKTKATNCYYSQDEIEIINGFVQLHLEQSIYLQFIGIINAYVSLSNGFQFIELKGCYKALEKIIKHSHEKIIYVEIASCNDIVKVAVNELERSKSEEIIV